MTANRTVVVPNALVRGTLAREGPSAQPWLDSLPEVVNLLVDRWSCTIDGALRHGGVGLVVPVLGAQGPMVIKISFPHEENRGEGEALRLLDGAAAVRIHAQEEQHWALLLERADGPSPAEILGPEESVEMMADLSARLTVPAGPQMRTLAGTASGWSQQLDQQLAQAPPDAIGSAVLARAREAIALVASDTTATLLHGDLHEGNVLGATREPWLSIDLKGWAGTAAFDAFTVALTRHHDLRHVRDPISLVRDRITRFASTAQVDPHLAVEIAHARAVSSLLYETVTRANTFGRELLDQLVRTPG